MMASSAPVTMLGRCVSRTFSQKGQGMSTFRDRLMSSERNVGATMTHRAFQTWQPQDGKSSRRSEMQPGSKAFAECETDAIKDLFHNFAKTNGDGGIKYLDLDGVHKLLNSIGERPDERTLKRLYKAADYNGDGIIELHVSVLCENTWVSQENSFSDPISFA
jgi:hypothetical protein